MSDLGLNEPLDIDLEEIPEPSAVDAGMYDLLVTGVEFGMSKSSGNPMYTIYMDIVSEANAKTVKHYLTLPTESDDAATTNSKYLSIKWFAKACGLPLQGTVLSEAEGCTVTAFLSVEDDSKYGKSNKVRYFVEPGV